MLSDKSELTFKNNIGTIVYSTKVQSLGHFTGRRRIVHQGPPEMERIIASIQTPSHIVFYPENGKEEHIEIGKAGTFFNNKHEFSFDHVKFKWH
jgi:hypothetical protein